MFGAEFACHSGRDVWIWWGGAVYFVFIQNIPEATVTSYHLKGAFGMFEVHADSVGPVMQFGFCVTDGGADQNGRSAASTSCLVVEVGYETWNEDFLRR